MNENTKPFIKYCREGKLNECKELIKKFDDVDYTVRFAHKVEYAFCSACYNGHLNIVKWLVNIFDNINIHANDERAFCWACENGHLKIAKWLVNTFRNINDTACFVRKAEDAFCFACYNGHLKVAKWLVNIFKDINVHINNDRVFHWACKYKYIKIVKWLLYTFKTYNNIEILNGNEYKNILPPYIKRNIRLCKNDIKNNEFIERDLIERIEYVRKYFSKVMLEYFCRYTIL